METVKTDPEAGDGEFIDTRDPKDKESDALASTAPSNVGTKVMYDAEDGGKVTALVSTFDDDSDDEEMPGLIPVSELKKKAPSTIPTKPKLKGNTSSSNVSSSLSSKKRKHHHADRKGFNKKFKHWVPILCNENLYITSVFQSPYSAEARFRLLKLFRFLNSLSYASNAIDMYIFRRQSVSF